MDIATTLLCVAFAIMLVGSGLGKLRAPDRGAAAFDALRLTVPSPRAAAIALSLGELALALALVVLPGPWLVAAAAALSVLMAAFLIVVARAHRLGSTDDCGCFGSEGPSRIGRRLIVRNAVLTVAALLLGALALAGGGGVPSTLAAVAGGDLAPLAILAAGLLVGAGSYLIASGSSAPADPETSTAAPDTAAATPRPWRLTLPLLDPETGMVEDLAVKAYRRAQLVVFVKPGCGSCTQAIAAVEERRDEVTAIADVTFVVAAAPGQDISEERARLTGTTLPVLIDTAGVAATAAEVPVVRPSAMLIGTDGQLVPPFASGVGQVSELVEVLAAAAAEAQAPVAGA